MDLLIFLLLSSTVFAEDIQTSARTGSEPFLPIFPVYPYNSKLTKRQTDRDAATQLPSALYAPRTDESNLYAPALVNNLNKLTYAPNQNTYPKPASSLAYSPYYVTNPTYASNPYSLLNTYSGNPYVASSPYTATAYSASSYPNYFYQPSYYPSRYSNHPYPLFLPLPPGFAYPQPSKSDDLSEDSDDKDSKESKKSGHKTNKLRDSDRDSNESPFVDGANYISDSSKDLDVQSSSYKLRSPYNKLEESAEKQRTIYRIINVAGPQSNLDYLSDQTKIQLEQLMRQTLIRLLTQNVIQQSDQTPHPYNFDNNNPNRNGENYVTVPTTISKTGLKYVVNPTVYNNANPGPLVSNYNTPSPVGSIKNVKYSSSEYSQKPVNRITLNRSPGLYITPLNMNKTPTTTLAPDYADYDSVPSTQETRDYAGGDSRQDQDQDQDSVSYPTQNVAKAKAPQAFSYRYSTYHSDQSSDEIQTKKDTTEDFKSKSES